MIKEYTLLALQKALNHALALDDSSQEKMQKLNNKVLKIIIDPLDVFFFITFLNSELKLLANYADKPDIIINSNPIGLIRLSLLPASKSRSLFNDKIKISGDLELGQQVKKLFDELDVDWEGHLAHFTGDVVAHQIGELYRNGRDFTQKVSKSLKRNIVEYFQEEISEIPTPEEVGDFYNDIDELSLRVERSSAHINKLLVKHEVD